MSLLSPTTSIKEYDIEVESRKQQLLLQKEQTKARVRAALKIELLKLTAEDRKLSIKTLLSSTESSSPSYVEDSSQILQNIEEKVAQLRDLGTGQSIEQQIKTIQEALQQISATVGVA